MMMACRTGGGIRDAFEWQREKWNEENSFGESIEHDGLSPTPRWRTMQTDVTNGPLTVGRIVMNLPFIPLLSTICKRSSTTKMPYMSQRAAA
ncbi:hypothetical protein TTRE_0000265601 [Trichuris trichiura]|uniref:Uncharacterized protein n=1 Tax=Trichuris trichiura TaxID=36087 RepID=A0A077Z2X7_TRITR|nr:hypothetical protein TTRE_0000265601 [Trichuris trichiura]